MGESAERKALIPSRGDVDQDTASDTDARPTKKRKQDCSPSGEVYDLPAITRYLPLAIGGLQWRGQMSLENAVVFGDSYSESREGENDEEPNTWIGHILERRLDPPTHVHNFAFPGATAEDDLSNQLSRFENSSYHLSLEGENTVHCFYLGINDCGRTPPDELEPIVEAIFDVLHDLYVKFGARNFVLIDIPPIDRSPGAVESGSTEDIKERIETWNELLRSHAKGFAKGSEKATTFVFSSHQVLVEVLDEPLDFDFAGDDPETEGAGIWKDDLHLTPAVHAIFAKRLLDSLIRP